MTKGMKIICAAVAGLGFGMSAANAATRETNLGVSAFVLDSCVITAVTPLGFGNLDTSTTTNDSIPGLIRVTCSAPKTGATVTLGGGGNVSGSTRRMSDGGSAHVPYSVFKSTARNAASEVGIGGELWSGNIAAATAENIPVYGQIPAGSYTTGNYSDTILVTLTYPD